MKYGYGWEKLHTAVHSLAASQTQKERLVNALVFNLTHITPENDLPEPMHEDFKNFISEMTSVEPKSDEGSYQATVNTLDQIGVDRAIAKIIGFYDTVCRYSEPF
ncbi:hypothetical protein C942_00515 [Photobacterium marinum]|uniref:Uncharacterized protein n=2 Tax=Photobacterium marinum TaxID=1056511 RepID=L8JCQ5_9GAMM|nr:hypothetical protein C942_00515 [Photobacterium marinum]